MRTIVMTGGTSGIGAVAGERLAAQATATLMLGARRPTAPNQLPLDLERLDSVRAFADEVVNRLGARHIDALILNAGVSYTDADHRSADGHEATFAVNHLAHYLLLRRLMPRLAADARVVITTSSVHDPQQPTVVPIDRTPGGRAYAHSKLCNVLTARALAARGPQWRVVAFDPGPTPGTNLSRNYSPILRLGWRLMGSPVGRVFSRLNSKQRAGEVLAALATDEPVGASGYASLVRGTLRWPQPAVVARTEDAGDALWRESAALVGLPATAP